VNNMKYKILSIVLAVLMATFLIANPGWVQDNLNSRFNDAQVTFSDVTVTDDLIVTDDVTIGGDVTVVGSTTTTQTVTTLNVTGTLSNGGGALSIPDSISMTGSIARGVGGAFTVQDTLNSPVALMSTGAGNGALAILDTLNMQGPILSTGVGFGPVTVRDSLNIQGVILSTGVGFGPVTIADSLQVDSALTVGALGEYIGTSAKTLVLAQYRGKPGGVGSMSRDSLTIAGLDSDDWITGTISRMAIADTSIVLTYIKPTTGGVADGKALLKFSAPPSDTIGVDVMVWED
jgi:hypothetical protein